MSSYSFRELAALIVSDISRRRADKSRDIVLLHIFGHIYSYKSALVTEHYFSKSLRELCLTYTGSAQEDERTGRSLLVLETEPAAADGLGDSMNGLILADDSLLEFCFEILKLIGIRFCDLRSRDAGPLGKDYGNIVYRKCACEAVLIRLDLILKERELFRQLLLFLSSSRDRSLPLNLRS